MNSLINAGLFFVATSAVVILSIFLFNLVTRYDVWREINKGNLAVAFSTGGIVLGVSNIMRFAITTNDKLAPTVMWGSIGTLVLLAVYFAFEILTPKLNVNEEIGKGNKAVGFISFIFSIGFSYIIGASIS